MHTGLVGLLAAHGGGLEALALSGPKIPKEIAAAASAHCMCLRRLRLEVDRWNAERRWKRADRPGARRARREGSPAVAQSSA